MKFCEEIVDVQVSNFGNGCISYMTGHLAQSNAFESAWVVTTVTHYVLISVRGFYMRSC